jgi:hypothetical protein
MAYFKNTHIAKSENSFLAINRQQILGFINDTINKETYHEVRGEQSQSLDYWDFFPEDEYNYTSQLSAVLLLEQFSEYSQEIKSISSSALKDAINISVAFIYGNRQFFSIGLKKKIDESLMYLSINQILSEINYESDYSFYKNCVVTDVKLEIDVPISQKGIDLSSDVNVVFFSKLKNPYPVKFCKHNLTIIFNDSSGKEVELTIYNPPILIAKDFSWLNKVVGSDYVPTATISIEKYIMTALTGFDFSDIDFLSDINCISANKEISDLIFSDNKRLLFFISGLHSTGRDFNKYNIYKLDVDLICKKATIEFHKFEYNYF